VKGKRLKVKEKLKKPDGPRGSGNQEVGIRISGYQENYLARNSKPEFKLWNIIDI
jgi:hypothetical protein